ncbi:MAG: dTMP kinase [Clostridiaceae bacterium]|nr:dTMP kinase [Clostridiaceae bacterium]
MMYNEEKLKVKDPAIPDARGRLITFEGIDGTGKSTQIVRLTEKLREMGKTVQVLREPGGTAIGESVREILLDRRHTNMCEETELLLFAAARAQLVREIILPALETGSWVICDRFYDSTVAYQGYGRGLDLNVIGALNQLAIGTCRPDITILLDLPVELAVKRLTGRKEKADRLDNESLAFMQQIRDGYRNLALAEPDRLILMDAAQPETVLAADIYRVIREGFGI